MPAWLEIAYSTVNPLDLATLGGIVDDLTKAMFDGRFKDMSAAFETAAPSQMSVDAIVAICRTTYMARDDIPMWRPFVARCHTDLLARGENADRLLRGLILVDEK